MAGSVGEDEDAGLVGGEMDGLVFLIFAGRGRGDGGIGVHTSAKMCAVAKLTDVSMGSLPVLTMKWRSARGSLRRMKPSWSRVLASAEGASCRAGRTADWRAWPSWVASGIKTKALLRRPRSGRGLPSGSSVGR